MKLDVINVKINTLLIQKLDYVIHSMIIVLNKQMKLDVINVKINILLIQKLDYVIHSLIIV